jgi:hypothetical protein
MLYNKEDHQVSIYAAITPPPPPASPTVTPQAPAPRPRAAPPAPSPPTPGYPFRIQRVPLWHPKLTTIMG